MIQLYIYINYFNYLIHQYCWGIFINNDFMQRNEKMFCVHRLCWCRLVILIFDENKNLLYN